MDEAIYTSRRRPGRRMSEIRALKVSDVDFEVDVLRLEDGYTTTAATPATRAGAYGRCR